MDLGCLDLGCISVSEKHSNGEGSLDSEKKEGGSTESGSANAKVGKNKALKELGQSTVNALNKFTSQIKKPPHRKTSPLNWFPRKKVEPYLKRKIKLLQEVGGMNLTLDETLGDSNPHYSRVEREQIAAREAACKAMEARKAAMVEASWCRILRAARIQTKEAEALLVKAERSAAEAFEAAAAMRVIMYDIPNCAQKPYEISSINGGGSTTHTVAASFETAFEVDKEVAAAVKAAFVRLANCPSFNRDEFKDLMWKISQNPDTGENNHELSDFSSDCESDTGSEAEANFQKDHFSSQDLNYKLPVAEARQRRHKKRQLYENFNMSKLVDMMLERLRCLQEDELASLATIVATCGLNAALAEVENSKQHDLGSVTDYSSASALNFARRMSSLGAGTYKNSDMEHLMDGQLRRKQAESEVPSLDKCLVKHLSKLEREVLEAKNTRSNQSTEGIVHNPDKSGDRKVNSHNNITSSESIQDLESILVKHSSKLEKEIEEAKKNSGRMFERGCKKSESNLTFSETVPDLGSVLIKHSSKLEKEIEENKRNCAKLYEVVGHTKQDVPEIPSLDKFLVKHVSRLEREVQEAKNRRKVVPIGGGRVADSKKKIDSFIPITQSEESGSSLRSEPGQVGKENIDLNKEVDVNVKTEQKECSANSMSQSIVECSGESLTQIRQANGDSGETILVEDGNAGIKETENSLDKILVKPVHRLEREKMQALSLGSDHGRINRHQKKQVGNNTRDCESSDKVLVKHVSRLEKERMRVRSKEEEVVMVKRSRDTNMQSEKHEEGSLDKVLVKHKSRLEREKMAAAQQPGEEIRHSYVARKQARERELQEAWGGLSLGNSIRPHLSRLERDKAAWIKAEEEEKRQDMREEA